MILLNYQILHSPPRQTLSLSVKGLAFSDFISCQPGLVREEAVEGVELGVAEEGGDALGAEFCGGQELDDGTKAIDAEEVIVIHIGEEMNGGAEFASIDVECFGYGQDAFELAMEQVIADYGGDDAAIVEWEGDFIDGFHGKKVMLFVNDKSLRYWHINFVKCVLCKRIIH